GTSWSDACRAAPEAVLSQRWVDIGGQLMPAARLEQLVAAVEDGSVPDVAAFGAALDRIQAGYAEDEWVWVKWAYEQLAGVALDGAGPAELLEVAETLRTHRREFIEAVLADAVKEFDRHSAVGFGADGPPGALDADFQAVRGDYETNKFIVQMRAELVALDARVAAFQRRVTPT
ncbi:MAG: DUF4954 family protein, partial [Pirellulaceae bacterium]|nr:DUF4954 family protein [Pirellulaceae bacterium]